MSEAARAIECESLRKEVFDLKMVVSDLRKEANDLTYERARLQTYLESARAEREQIQGTSSDRGDLRPPLKDFELNAQ